MNQACVNKENCTPALSPHISGKHPSELASQEMQSLVSNDYEEIGDMLYLRKCSMQKERTFSSPFEIKLANCPQE